MPRAAAPTLINLVSALLAVTALLALPARAAPLETPRPSPFAKAQQTVGITEITVDYSSPAVRARPIWGALEPWGAVWRAGANATTKLTFSRDVIIGSTNIPAGSYAFFVIPQQSGPWILIVNKDFQQGGAFKYSKDLDVVRVEVTPQAIPNRERLAYIFSNFTDDSGSLDLEWEKVRLSLPFKVATAAEVEAQIKAGDATSWEFNNQVANYERGQKQYDLALGYAEKSIKLKETWQNFWAKAQIEAAKGDTKSAIAAAEKARAFKDAPQNLLDDSAKAIAEWKARK